MSFAFRFRIREYLKGSLGFYPILGAVVGPLIAVLTHHIDSWISVPTSWQYSPATASTLLTTIVGAAVGLTGFVVTVTVLAIQMATGTFSARYMRIWYRDPLLKSTLAFLVATLVFSFALLRQVGSTAAPNVGVTVAGFLLVLSVVLFLLFFERFIHRLRPVAVAAFVARQVRGELNDISRRSGDKEARQADITAERKVTVVSDRTGALQAISVRGFLDWADKHDLFVAMESSIGDFVITGQPVLTVVGATTVSDAELRRLLGLFALGVERTIEQDPAFALRIIVDIAVKALSAAINDPTTAVQAIDHLETVLRVLGSTDLQSTLTFADRKGVRRLQIPGRTWEDFLTLGVTEIREYGCSAIQVMRRLRAMLEDLRESILPANCHAVDAEIARLDATVATGFAGSVDNDRADESDRQGIGGPTAETRGHAA